MSESGMIGDKEVVLSELTKFTWAIDIIKHTSDDTTELVEGWVLGDEYKALALYDEKVREITKEARFDYHTKRMKRVKEVFRKTAFYWKGEAHSCCKEVEE